MSHAWLARSAGVRRYLVTGLEASLFVMVLALLGLMILQVVTRYVMQMAVPWTEEVARMILVWMVMTGATVASDRSEHYAITFVSGRLRGTPRLLMLIVTNILGLVFLAALAFYGTAYLMANLKTVFVSTQTSRAWVYAALPICATLMAASLLLQTIEAWLQGEAADALPVAVTGDV